MQHIDDYDFSLPPGSIAQAPVGRRDASRLMVLSRGDGAVSHRVFGDLPDLLDPGDVLVVNDTKVVPGRLYGTKETGGRAEVLLLDYHKRRRRDDGSVVVTGLVKAAKRPKIGSAIRFREGLFAVVADLAGGTVSLRFPDAALLEEKLPEIGRMPLPPYIRRDEDSPAAPDMRSYQTVYARKDGAVAAPTAGLHFTKDVFDRLAEKGVRIAALTLHVGYGTFQPVRVTDIREHRMHAESFHLPADTAEAVNTAVDAGKRVVAVGTTCVRTLEYVADEDGRVAEAAGECDLFIYPGYRFKTVSAMVTNFHLPRSTLIMLVSAFAGRENVLSAYETAVASGYRFYSYGDAMFIR